MCDYTTTTNTIICFIPRLLVIIDVNLSNTCILKFNLIYLISSLL